MTAPRTCKRCKATLPVGATVCLYCAPRAAAGPGELSTAGPNARTVKLSVPDDPPTVPVPTADPLAATVFHTASSPAAAPARSYVAAPLPTLPADPAFTRDPARATALGPYGTRPVRLGGSDPRARAVFGPDMRAGRQLLIASGIVLFACVLAPWSWYQPVSFSWSVLAAPGALVAKALPLLLAAGGLLALFVGSLPVTGKGRSAAALIVGLLSLAGAVALGAAEWRHPLSAAGATALALGLALRWDDPPSRIARVLITVGAAMFLAPRLIPVGGVIPVEIAWRTVTTAGSPAAPAAGLDLSISLIAVIALLSWWPAPRRVGAIGWSFAFIALPIAVAAAQLVAAADPAAALASAPVEHLYLPLATATWTAMVAFGGAAVLAREAS